nr:MAG TPA: hypothetical protein [Bacteriophage sp.]
MFAPFAFRIGVSEVDFSIAFHLHSDCGVAEQSFCSLKGKHVTLFVSRFIVVEKVTIFFNQVEENIVDRFTRSGHWAYTSSCLLSIGLCSRSNLLASGLLLRCGRSRSLRCSLHSRQLCLKCSHLFHHRRNARVFVLLCAFLRLAKIDLRVADATVDLIVTLVDNIDHAIGDFRTIIVLQSNHMTANTMNLRNIGNLHEPRRCIHIVFTNDAVDLFIEENRVLPVVKIKRMINTISLILIKLNTTIAEHRCARVDVFHIREWHRQNRWDPTAAFQIILSELTGKIDRTDAVIKYLYWGICFVIQDLVSLDLFLGGLLSARTPRWIT